MDGFTFINKVMNQDGLEVSTWLSKLGKTEKSAVEFKASFLPSVDDDDTPDACSWNVISDIIAIANSDGGCILLGVDNLGEYAKGYLGTLSFDEYKRRLDDHLRNKSQWSFKNKVYTIESNYRLQLLKCIENGVYDGKINGKDILIIHIRPTDFKLPIIYKCRRQDEKPENAKEYITYRTKGDIASKETKLIDVKVITDFITNRSIESGYYKQLWKNYIGKNNITYFFLIIYIFIAIIQVYLIYTDTVFNASSLEVLNASSSEVLNVSSPEIKHKKYRIILNILEKIKTKKIKKEELEIIPTKKDPIKEAFDYKFLTIFLSFPICFIIHSYLMSKSKNRATILANLHYFILSFLVSSIFFMLKLYMDGVPKPFKTISLYQCGFGLSLFIVIFCTILIPILLPKEKVSGMIIYPIEIEVKPIYWTWESVCIDAGYFWNTLETYKYWKLQQHKLTGHCRILDPYKIRRCYGGRSKVVPIFNDVKKQIDHNINT